jgi:hypothetical protein
VLVVRFAPGVSISDAFSLYVTVRGCDVGERAQQDEALPTSTRLRETIHAYLKEGKGETFFCNEMDSNPPIHHATAVNRSNWLKMAVGGEA